MAGISRALKCTNKFTVCRGGGPFKSFPEPGIQTIGTVNVTVLK